MVFQKGNKFWLGKKRSPESIEKSRLARIGKYCGVNSSMYGVHRYGKDNPNYGKFKTYAKSKAIHLYIKSRLPKPIECPFCGRLVRLELCNINPIHNPETYNRDFKNWYYACRKCHMSDDGRLDKLMTKYNTRRDLSIRSIKESCQRWNWLLL